MLRMIFTTAVILSGYLLGWRISAAFQPHSAPDDDAHGQSEHFSSGE